MQITDNVLQEWNVVRRTLEFFDGARANVRTFGLTTILVVYGASFSLQLAPLLVFGVVLGIVIVVMDTRARALLNSKETELFEKIKSRGYWEIEIKPTKYKKDRLSLGECKQIVEKSEVRVRGWYYPYISNRRDEFFSGNNYVESLVDWQEHKEMWRMYQSGQFVHYLSLWEDWPREYRGLFGAPDSQASRYKPGTIQEVIMTLYTITEIFVFTSRLASNKLFDDALHISLELHGTENRSLNFFDTRRSLLNDYRCMIDNISIKKHFTVQEILANNDTLAMDTVVEIFDRFNWHSDKIRVVLKEDQEGLLKGLI